MLRLRYIDIKNPLCKSVSGIEYYMLYAYTVYTHMYVLERKNNQKEKKKKKKKRYFFML